MEDVSNGAGSTILSIAIAAGWVAIGALILRVLLGGLKALITKFKGEEDL